MLKYIRLFAILATSPFIAIGYLACCAWQNLWLGWQLAKYNGDKHRFI